MSKAEGALALVMGGGGARAAYQVGFLSCLAHHWPLLHAPILTGVSAGAINAAFLACHAGRFDAAVDDLVELWSNLTTEQVIESDTLSFTSTIARWGMRLVSGGSSVGPSVRGLVDTAPLRKLLEQALRAEDGVLVGIDEKVRRGALSAIGITTTDYATGQSITHVQGADPPMWRRPHRRSEPAVLTVDHVMASSALPLFFPAVQVGESWHGDGGVRLTAPLAPALHLGAERILAISTRYRRSQGEADRPVIQGYPPPAQVLGVLMNAIFLDMLDHDALNMARINQLVESLPPERRGDLRVARLLVLRPSQDLARLAGEYEPRLPQPFRFLTRGLGTRETRSPDSLSMILFEPGYLRHLIQLGIQDAERRLPEIEAFLEGRGDPSAPAHGLLAHLRPAGPNVRAAWSPGPLGSPWDRSARPRYRGRARGPRRTSHARGLHAAPFRDRGRLPRPTAPGPTSRAGPRRRDARARPARPRRARGPPARARQRAPRRRQRAAAGTLARRARVAGPAAGQGRGRARETGDPRRGQPRRTPGPLQRAGPVADRGAARTRRRRRADPRPARSRPRSTSCRAPTPIRPSCASPRPCRRPRPAVTASTTTATDARARIPSPTSTATARSRGCGSPIPRAPGCADEADPRASVEADRAKGQRGRWKLVREGRDSDGDGLAAEDGPRNAVVNENFASGWREHGPRAGQFPMDEPEARALADFVIEHRDIALVLSYGVLDNLVEAPEQVKEPEGGGRRRFGGGPPEAGWLERDARLLAELARRRKEATGREPEGSGDGEGSFQTWAYDHRGLFSLAATLWDVPTEVPSEVPSGEDAQPPDAAEAEQPAPSVAGAAEARRGPAVTRPGVWPGATRAASKRASSPGPPSSTPSSARSRSAASCPTRASSRPRDAARDRAGRARLPARPGRAAPARRDRRRPGARARPTGWSR